MNGAPLGARDPQFAQYTKPTTHEIYTRTPFNCGKTKYLPTQFSAFCESASSKLHDLSSHRREKSRFCSLTFNYNTKQSLVQFQAVRGGAVEWEQHAIK
jgi:hypothetical protein